MGKVAILVKAEACAWLTTAALLLFLSFLMYRFEAVEEKLVFGVMAVYVFSNLLGGFLAGRRQEKHRFLWGMITGVLYFFLLILIAALAGVQAQATALNLISVFFLCTGSGMLGGMFS